MRSEAIEYVLENEGGFVDRSDDHGGPTNFGITVETLSKWRKYTCTRADVLNLPKTEAIDIYGAFFWDPIHLDGLPLFAATAILDTAVNMGQDFAVKAAQRALGLVWDGVLGPKTIDAIRYAAPPEFIFNYVGEIQDHYAAIVVADPIQRVNLKGWLKRSRRLFLLV